MDAIRQGVRDLASGKIRFPNSPIVGLGEESSVAGEISGKLFGVGSLSAGFILKEVTYDPGDSSPERSAVYLAIRW